MHVIHEGAGVEGRRVRRGEARDLRWRGWDGVRPPGKSFLLRTQDGFAGPVYALLGQKSDTLDGHLAGSVRRSTGEEICTEPEGQHYGGGVAEHSPHRQREPWRSPLSKKGSAYRRFCQAGGAFAAESGRKGPKPGLTLPGRAGGTKPAANRGSSEVERENAVGIWESQKTARSG